MFKKIGLNTLVSSAGRIIGGLLGLVSIGFITRALGQSGFGEYSTIIAYLTVFQILADFGLYQYLTKEISQNPEKEEELVGQYFTLRLFVAVIFLVLATALIWLFPYSQDVKLGVVIAASAFLFMSLTQIFMSIFQKYLQIYKAAISEVVGRLVQVALVWYFFTQGGGLFHYLVTIILGSFVIFILNLIFARRLVSFKLSVNVSAWKQIIKTTYPIAISIVFTLLYFKADILLLSLMRPQEDVGVYGAAYKVLELLIFFPAAFVGLLLPTLSKYAKENKEKFSRLLARLTDLITLMALPLVFGGILVSATIVFYIGGAEFLISALPLQILFLAIGIIFFGTLYGNSIVALGLQKKAMWAYVLGFIFNFVANLIVIPRYTYIGASWTTVLTELLVTGYLVYVIYQVVPLKFPWEVSRKIVFATIIMASVAFYFINVFPQPLSAVMFLALLAISAGVYLALAYAMRLHNLFKLPKEEAYKNFGT